MYNGKKIVVFDLTRSQETHINYEVMESIKNCLICSMKYVPTTKTFEIPHLVVFAHFEPDYSKMSRDRKDVRKLDINDLEFAYGSLQNEFAFVSTSRIVGPRKSDSSVKPDLYNDEDII